MKLLTKKILKDFEKQGDTSEMEAKDIKIIVKFFGSGHFTWYAVEYDVDSRVFYGFVSLFNDHNDECGSFALDDLQELKFPPFGLSVERDMYFGDHNLQEIIDGARP